MNYQQILTELRNKEYHPVYFLHGNESFFIDSISNFIENKVLTEAEKSFNQTVFYGKETEASAVIDVALRYPMMAMRQVVVVKEAQEMKGLNELSSYIEKPSEKTVLVICHKHKKFNSSTKFGKLLKAKTVFFESKKLYDNQVPDWIRNYLKSRKLGVTSLAANLMAEYLGTDLAKVANELDKLALNLPAGTEVDDKLVEEHIGISREYNIFELQRALGKRDILKAGRILNYFSANPRKNPMVLVIGTLFNFFSKIYQLHFLKNSSEREQLQKLNLRSAYALKEYRAAFRFYTFPKVQQVLSILREYDLKSKGVDFNNVGKPEGILLKEMVWRILH